MLLPEQLATMRTYVAATPAANALYLAGDRAGLAAHFNTLVSPDFWVWKASVTTTEIMSNGFAWDRVDNLTVGRARIWEYLTQLGTFAPLPNVLAGINAAFNQAADAAMRLSIFGHCQQKATRFEKLFATGSGTTTTDTATGPARTTAFGPVIESDLIDL